jgi:hypothetical protein
VPLPQAAVDAGFGGSRTLDFDQDGLSDYYERLLGTRSDVADSDSDDVLDGEERALGSDPTSIDTDRDGVTDDLERQAGTLGPAPAPSTLPPAIDDTATDPTSHAVHADPGGVPDLHH